MNGCRMSDVGQPKADVAAQRVMERVEGVKVTPHFGRIEDEPDDFYRDFSIIILGLDSLDLAMVVAQLDDTLGIDPFAAGEARFDTVGQFAALYGQP